MAQLATAPESPQAAAAAACAERKHTDFSGPRITHFWQALRLRLSRLQPSSSASSASSTPTANSSLTWRTCCRASRLFSSDRSTVSAFWWPDRSMVSYNRHTQ